MAVQDPQWLQVGDSGEDVRALQQAINVWLLYQTTVGVTGCDGLTRPSPLEEDGRFGPLTEAAVVWMQCRFTLDQDGLAGPRTLDALARHLKSQGLGELSFGGERGVLPVRYRATEAANALRQRFGLPPLVPLPASPPEVAPAPKGMAPWLPWAVLAVGAVAFWRRRRRA